MLISNSPQMNNSLMGISTLHWISGLLFSVIIISWIAYQQWAMKHPVEVINLAFDTHCDLRAGPCETNLADGSRVSFSIEPRNIPLNEQLTLEVIISGLTVDKVAVDINGVDMKMPANTVHLKPVGAGHYRAKGELSFCTRKVMEWESVVQLSIDHKQIRVPYRFITNKGLY